MLRTTDQPVGSSGLGLTPAPSHLLPLVAPLFLSFSVIRSNILVVVDATPPSRPSNPPTGGLSRDDSQYSLVATRRSQCSLEPVRRDALAPRLLFSFLSFSTFPIVRRVVFQIFFQSWFNRIHTHFIFLRLSFSWPLFP